MIVIHIVHRFIHSTKRKKAFEIKAFFKMRLDMGVADFQFSGKLRLTEHRKNYVT